ncbi:MAG: DUF6265 family protein [Longimicrobiales bacterium]
MRSILLAFTFAAVAADGSRAQEAPLHHLAWLAGCWEHAAGGTVIEEQWMRPRGGLMPGTSRTLRGGLAAAWEFMRIEARLSGVVFLAQPQGASSVEFRAVQLTDSVAVFDNPEHDFPQRIIYRHTSGDSLHARIEGDRRGRSQGIDFVYGRTACER